MASQSTPHIVIRLVPESPVDGWTFSTYLEGLALQIVDPNTPNTSDPLSNLVYSSPLILAQLTPGSGIYYYSVSVPTSESTKYINGNYGTTLAFDATDGIPVGASFATIAQIDEGSGLTVVEVTGKDKQASSATQNTIQLSDVLQKYVPAGTVALFFANSNTGPPNSPLTPFSFDLETSSAATDVNGELLILHFVDTSGVTIGMTVSDSSSIASGTTVTAVNPTTVVVSQALLGSPSSVKFIMEPPYIWVQRTPTSGSPVAHPRTLKFTPSDVDGLVVGMTLQPVKGRVAPGTTVLQVIKGADEATTTVTLSQGLLRRLPHGHDVTFTYPLSSGIAQHTLGIFDDSSFFPAAVATAVIPLNSAPPDYLDIGIKATRGQELIPISKTFYNVRWSSDVLPETPDQYQAIPASDTSLYLALPPPPALKPISLTIPSDGSAPQFDELKGAIQTTLANEQEKALAADPIRDATLSSLITSPALCARISYDIVWSDQNNLPAPPDPLESLYTNPPNPGGGGGNSSGHNTSDDNNLEQDRQKFEGALSSFYSTRNATAERLTKFVAAASAAVACEQMSVNSAAALLEFPVDPLPAFASAVESEILLEGLGAAGPSGLVFGVPAAFFYALGVHLDKTTAATQRFKMATGETIDRLLQQFATAENMQVIKDPEPFTDTSLALPDVTAFQAARRLAALGVSAASNSPLVTVFAGSSLALLVSKWLSATDPPAQNPPLTYQNNDFNIWTQQLAGTNPQGYVDLDLDALTRGYVIPPFAAAPSVGTASGSTLPFGLGSGIGVGMPVYGTHIAPGTTVQSIAAMVTLSRGLSGDVPAGSVIMFAPVAATTAAVCPAATASLTFGGTSGISLGMSVFGKNVAAGTTVLGVTATTVTLSRGVSGDVPAGSDITFAPVAATTAADSPAGTTSLAFAGPGAVSGISAGMPVSSFPAIAAGTTVLGAPVIEVTLSAPIAGLVSATSLLLFNFGITPVTAASTADCPPGTTLLTFGATDGISAGMLIFGANIAAGTAVHDVTATTVALSTSVAGDVPSGSDIIFVVPPATPLYPLTATTTTDCPPGITLTFAGTDGIGVGMPVSGTGIAADTIVRGVTATTVTLGTGVAADVPTGSVIMFGPVAASTTADCPSGTALLTFDAADGISNGMVVFGANIAAGTIVHDVAGTAVTLSAGVSADVPTGSIITFAVAAATSTADCAPGVTMTFGPGGTDGITVGMPTSGTNIAAGTTVHGVTATTVTLSTGVPADVPEGSVIAFAPVADVTTAKCLAGTASLTFDATDGISNGMSVFGINIAAGTTVHGVTATTVTLSADVPADVPAGSVISFAVVPSTLADQIAAWLPSTTSPSPPYPVVATLKQVTATQWTTFFTVVGSPQWLPPFTAPAGPAASSGQVTQKAGYVAARIRAFVRAVQEFFSVSTAATAAQLPPAGAAATFDLPAYDPIAQAVAGVGGGFTFGDALSATALAVAAQGVFPGDPAAQAWLCQATTTINELWKIAGAALVPAPQEGQLPYPVSYRFSVMEALYARGFCSAADISALPEADFAQALTGTVAFDSYDALRQEAQRLAPNSPPAGEPGGGFQPINPDGSLVDCIPPPWLSPTGPIAYLQEMLAVSELSTCEDVTAAPVTLVTTEDTPTATSVLTFESAAGVLMGMSAAASQIPAGTTVTTVTDATVTLSQSLTADAPTGTSVSFTAPTLGTVLAQRRGPVGELAASRANLETPMPLIDLVNECLEYIGAAAAPAGGTVYDTVYDTGADDPERRHDPALLLAALPEHSTPATPDAADAAVEPGVFNNLKADLSSCLLPYSQALDVSRTYVGQLGSSRFEEMRTFRRYVTEFVLDPAREPSGFESWLWRYPVRIDIAIEYLGITPEEYAMLFQAATAPGDEAPSEASKESRGVITLPRFLAATCLSYCEFYELWESGFVTFSCGTTDEGDGTFPECEPCCPGDVWLQFPGDEPGQDLFELTVFVRLWQKLRESCHGGYSFARLGDICDVLAMRAGDGVNPDFIRQLAAFQMLRDEFGLDLTDPDAPVAPGAVDADRTHLLALWVGPEAPRWRWALRQLITRVGEHAQRRHGCDRRPDEFVAMLTANLDQLSRLAGFDPDSATDSWPVLPTHTLRFAEVLAKVYASRFSVDELIFLFTADRHLDGEDPFPLQGRDEALDDPLGLPDDEPGHDLWLLHRDVLEADTEEAEETDDDWPWRRIEGSLQAEFGFAAADIAALGQHFFPGALARSGQPGTPSSRCFASGLAAASTSAAMWNYPPDGPLRYDPAAQQLTACIPLTDRAVIAKLTRVRELNADEQQAVQDLFFQPRALLARFALLFADFAVAQHELIEEADEECRFAYFRRQFLLCRRRSHLIARHLTRHVTAVTGQPAPDDDAAAALILRTMAADENDASTGWEADSGTPPPLTWALPGGSALAALLGVAGTGLVAEYRLADGTVAWRDESGGRHGSGDERGNCPVPTVLPGFDTTLTPEQLRFGSVHNGFVMKDSTGAWLGGAEGFTVTWSGALLIEHDGTYDFWAGEPASGEHGPDDATAGCDRWRVIICHGQRVRAILGHDWPGQDEQPTASLPLKRGAYELTAELVRPAPDPGDDEGPPRRDGFRVEYRGPDSDGHRTEIPHRALFALDKDQTLGAGIGGLSQAAAEYLSGLYVSSLRDIRRTYQRAFKALLFCRRLGLSARPQPHGTSELGYLLGQPTQFAGAGYYRTEGGFTQHLADLDFDFLPLRDHYRPPAPGQDARTAPSPQRVQAMFDWWERLLDYGVARADVHRTDGRELWHLFEQAHEKEPAHPDYLLRYLAEDSRRWRLDLRYFQGQDAPVYEVTSTDLSDERWMLRAWHAGRWLRAAQDRFAARDIETARPDLWASDDPSAQLPGETQTGNANLLAFVTDGWLDNGALPHYDDLRRLNDGLRKRGRRALISYLCQMDRVPLPWQPGQFATTPGDLSALLLLNVEAGPHEKASRIEEAISAAQTFVRRCLLGLEPGWTVTREFARLWDSHFETYRTWERARRRELYRESWIEWDDLDRARRVEAFRFLESQLRASTLSLAAPGGADWWTDGDAVPGRPPGLLQRRVPSELSVLPPAPAWTTATGTTVSPTTREGLTTLGRPEHASQPTWLAAIPQNTGAGPGVASIAAAAAAGTAQPDSLPLWMEAAMKLGTRFVRVAAAGPPEAALRFVPHSTEPDGVCCRECGCDHPAGVDEYYFWLIDTQVYTYSADTDASDNGDASFSGSYQFGFQDSYYDQFQQQSAEWDDEDQVPPLLAKWRPGPAVRLAWCRVHNGEFGQPRRSEGYVAVVAPPDLLFLGRADDSLYFEVTGSAPLPPGYGSAGDGGGNADPSPPGFRYDLPSDQAVALPQVLEPPAPNATYPGGLLSYPFFAYDKPGARLFPASWFSTSLAVAGALRSRCGYELALRWYRRAFDPLQRDCAWTHCPRGVARATEVTGAVPMADEIAEHAYLIWQEHGHPDGETDQDWRLAEADLRQAATAGEAERGRETARPGACCDATQVTEQGARDRAVTLHYCRTLVDWADALMRRDRSPEAFGQARVLYEMAARITGARPRVILPPEPGDASTVTEFVPAYAPLNPKLIELYDVIGDRLGRIQLGPGTPYFGNGAAAGCAEEEDLCERPSPYRFVSQITKAIELAGRVRELGAALLSAYEKGDAEHLAAIHAEQEREMAALGVAIRQDQWRDADWQVQALQQTKDVNQANLLYYAALYQNGLINNEIQSQDLTTIAMATRTDANMVEAMGEIMNILPDPFVGALSSGATVPVGTKLAHLFEAIGRIMQTVADVLSTTASMDMTQAGWERRAVEWLHQMQTLPIEIRQIELQILGAHRRRDQALRELNNQQRQVEHATETLDFLRDKFTAADLYLWLQKETAGLHRQMYELARRAAREAERSFNFELRRGHQRFVPEETWDDLHAGLLAGERLDFALRRMEKAYLDENRRELELTEHFSLRLDFPVAYLRLRTTGYCEIAVPEWMYDVHYPGHFLRRLKAVQATAPMVASPLTGVHCRLTLLSSTTRVSAEVGPPPGHCCRDHVRYSEYAPCPDDPRVVREYAARESIATSSGQNDSGLFELSFRDERYLPFEYLGAVSRWRIELPPDNNYFDLDTLTDLVLHVSYTAREGGAALREAAARDARGRLPGDGVRMFDVRHDFPDAWPALREPTRGDEPGGRPRQLRLGFTRAMFPFVPGRPVRTIDRLTLMFAAPDAEPGRHHMVRFWRDEDDHGRAAEVECVAGQAWPGFFCGTIDLREHPLGPLPDDRHDRHAACTFELPARAGRIQTVFVVASYDAAPGDRKAERCFPPNPPR